MIYLLRIEIDGHWHGSPDVPRPWVARIDGIDGYRYGLRRTFIEPMRDWKDARRACSGNLYGVVHAYALRAGNLYEVFRARGKPSKRHMVHEFLRLDEGSKRHSLEAIDALAVVDGFGDDVVVHEVPASDDGPSWVAEVHGLGTPKRLGWITTGTGRTYRMRRGCVYEVCCGGQRRLMRDGETLTELEAWTWLRAS